MKVPAEVLAADKPAVVFSPHPLLASAGRTVYAAEIEPGETLLQYLVRLGIPALTQPMTVRIEGHLVPPSMWARTWPKQGNLITVRAEVRGGGNSEGGTKNPLATVLTIVLLVVVTAYTGPGGLAAWQAGAIMVGGSYLINNVIAPPLKPKLSELGGKNDDASPTYSLSGGSNRARPFEQLPLVIGKHRMFPDYGAKEYTEFQGDEQYLYQVFNFGLSDLVLSDFRIGNTAITDFSGVTIEESGADGVLKLFPTNVDTVAGAAMLFATGFITRTSSVNATQLAVEIAGDLYRVTATGIVAHNVTIQIQYRLVGAGAWTDLQYVSDATPVVIAPSGGGSGWIGNALAQAKAALQVIEFNQLNPGLNPGEASIISSSRKTLRRTYKWNVDPGQYEVRVKRVSPDDVVDTNVSNLVYTQLRTYQADTADYTGQKRVAVKIKASGQLSDNIDSFNALASARCESWDGAAWVLTENSNPAWWVRWFAKGKKIGSRRAFGANLADARIDAEGLKAFGAWCTSKNLKINAVLDRPMNCADVLNTIARIGRGQTTWATGKIGAVWDAPNQTTVAVFGMPNMVAGTFAVDYVSEKLADEIVIQFVNEANDWQNDTVRALVPGIISPENPTTIELFGCTDMDQAGREANLTAANQVYRRRRVRWESDMEGNVANRGDVVILSHDLTQWDVSGRLLEGSTASVLILDRPITFQPATTPTILVRLPDGTFGYYGVVNAGGTQTTITLNTPLPEVPGVDPNYPAPDYLFFFGPLATPGKKVKVIDVEPSAKNRIKFIAFDESSSYYLAESNTYTYVAPGVSPLDVPTLSNLVFTEELVQVSGGWAVNLTLTWDTAGPYDSATVRAAVGSDVLQVRGSTFDRRLSFLVPDAGVVNVEITGYANGKWSTSSRLTAARTILGKSAAPSAALNFAALAKPYEIQLTWDDIPDPDRDQYEVRRGASFNAGTFVYRGNANIAKDLPRANGTYTYWIRSFDTSDNPSATDSSTSIVIDVIGAPTVSVIPTGNDAMITWTPPTMQFAADTYEVRYGASFSAGILVGTTKSLYYKVPVDWTGSRTFFVAVKDVGGQMSTAGSASLNIVAAGAPTVSVIPAGQNIVLAWTPVAGSLATREYEIRYGASYAAGTPVTRTKATTWPMKVTWLGDRQFWVVAYDQNDNPGTPGTATFTVTAPSAPSMTFEVIANNITLKWTDAKQTLPVDTYEIRTGPIFSSAAVRGKVTALFKTLFETAAGTYKYWVVGIDSAGNYGTETSVSATVSQPPGYVLYQTYDSQMDSTSRSKVLRVRGDNYVLGLDGATQYLSTPDTTDLRVGAGDFSLEFWFKTTGTGNYRLMTKRSAGSTNWYSVYLSNGTLNLEIGSSYPTHYNMFPATGSYKDGVWHQAIAVRDAGTLRWFIDGAAQGTATDNTNSFTLDDAANPDFTHGAWNGGGFFPGEVGPMRVYKRALSSTEAGEHYRGIFKTETSIVGAWDHDEGSGVVSNDDTDNNNNLNLISAPVWIKSTLDGRCDLTAGPQLSYYPVNTTQTFAEWGTANGFTTLQDSITAGFSTFLSAAPTTAQVREDFDYGQVLASTKIVVTLDRSAVLGTVTVTPTISYKKLIGDPWTDVVGVWSAYATSFRYVRVTLDAAGAGGNNVDSATRFNVHLDVQQSHDAGTFATVLGGARVQGTITDDYDSRLWVSGSTPTGYTRNEDTANESQWLSRAGPSGANEIVNVCFNQNPAFNGPSGGWDTGTTIPVDKTKSYMFAVFMKRKTANGDRYWGTGSNGASNLLTLAGASDGNPYFWYKGSYGELTNNDQWYLVVGFIHENGYGTTDTAISGVYDLTGTKIRNGVEYKWPADATLTKHRAYHYYNTVDGAGVEVQQMARPIVIQCDVANATAMIAYITRCAKEYGIETLFAFGFTDVQSITVSPNTQGIPITPVYDFVRTPLPKHFNTFLLSGSTLVAGNGSWGAEGV